MLRRNIFKQNGKMKKRDYPSIYSERMAARYERHGKIEPRTYRPERKGKRRFRIPHTGGGYVINKRHFMRGDKIVYCVDYVSMGIIHQSSYAFQMISALNRSKSRVRGPVWRISRPFPRYTRSGKRSYGKWNLV